MQMFPKTVEAALNPSTALSDTENTLFASTALLLHLLSSCASEHTVVQVVIQTIPTLQVQSEAREDQRRMYPNFPSATYSRDSPKA